MLNFDSLLDLVHGLGVLALVSMTYGFFVRRDVPSVVNSAGLGLCFGLGAVIAMTTPLQITQGVFIDARAVVLTLAGPFGGFIAALVAVLVCGAYRLWLGGVGAGPGVAGIVLAAVVGLLFAHFTPRRRGGYSMAQRFQLGMASSTMGFTLLLLPKEIAWSAFKVAFLPLTASNIIGVMLLGRFLSSEAVRLRISKSFEREAMTDALTNLPNRRQFDLASAQLVSDARRENTPISLLMIDVDRFKQVNDRFGHDVGDTVLKAVAATIEANIRIEDLIARYGGEEIVVVMPGTCSDLAMEAAERIREAVDQEVFVGSREAWNVTVSIGAVSAKGPDIDFGSMFKAADEALYRAKAAGRNKVRVAEQPSNSQSIAEPIAAE